MADTTVGALAIRFNSIRFACTCTQTDWEWSLMFYVYCFIAINEQYAEYYCCCNGGCASNDDVDGDSVVWCESSVWARKQISYKFTSNLFFEWFFSAIFAEAPNCINYSHIWIQFFSLLIVELRKKIEWTNSGRCHILLHWNSAILSENNKCSENGEEDIRVFYYHIVEMGRTDECERNACDLLTRVLYVWSIWRGIHYGRLV